MGHWAWNKSAAGVNRRYFEFVRQGPSGSAASEEVGVSLSCGSLWFIDAGSVKFIDTVMLMLMRQSGSPTERRSRPSPLAAAESPPTRVIPR